MYPENPEGTQAIVGSMNMGYDIWTNGFERRKDCQTLEL